MEAIYIALAVALASHMGLCNAVALVLKPLGRTVCKIIRCPKCLAFWLTIIYCLGDSHPLLASVMISLICAYAVQWLILILELIYKFYIKVWQKWISEK
jgi:hypothetical protein